MGRRWPWLLALAAAAPRASRAARLLAEGPPGGAPAAFLSRQAPPAPAAAASPVPPPAAASAPPGLALAPAPAPRRELSKKERKALEDAAKEEERKRKRAFEEKKDEIIRAHEKEATAIRDETEAIKAQVEKEMKITRETILESEVPILYQAAKNAFEPLHAELDSALAQHGNFTREYAQTLRAWVVAAFRSMAQQELSYYLHKQDVTQAQAAQFGHEFSEMLVPKQVQAMEASIQEKLRMLAKTNANVVDVWKLAQGLATNSSANARYALWLANQQGHGAWEAMREATAHTQDAHARTVQARESAHILDIVFDDATGAVQRTDAEATKAEGMAEADLEWGKTTLADVEQRKKKIEALSFNVSQAGGDAASAAQAARDALTESEGLSMR